MLYFRGGVYKMNNKEHLNEERYQKTKKKINIIGIGLLCIGLLLAILGFVTTFIMHNENNLFFLMFLGVPMTFIGFFLIIVSHMREISAFTAQQQMPIAKEGIEKISPSVGVAAKEITKGVKEGLKDEKK